MASRATQGPDPLTPGVTASVDRPADQVDLARIVSLAEFEPLARERMSEGAYDYVAGGSWDEVTLRESLGSWARFRFVPRVLRDIRQVDVSGTFLGRRAALPIAVAPMIAQAMAHPEAEVAAVRGAASAGVPYCLSLGASRTIEEAAAASPDAERWFQLYLVKDLAYCRSLAERAEAAGFRALVLTVDLPVLGYRERNLRSGFALPPMPNLEAVRQGPEETYGGLERQRSLGLTWDDVAAMRTWTSLPLVLKGILSTADARLAVQAGASAVVVSTHGARQLDRSVTGAEVLQEIVEAVDGRCEVWADGGIRRGLDVATALALGASGVLVGRPIFWALAAGGSAGVVRVCEILREELELAMALLGASSIHELTGDLVRGPRPS